MTKHLVSCLATCIAIAGTSASVARPRDTILQSPWDTPVSAHSRGQDGSSCPTAPDLPRKLTLTDYYSDPAHSIIDPVRKKAYDAQMKPLMAALHAVEKMADDYRHTGDVASAECVATWLGHFASDKAFEDVSTNQDTYVQGWMLGAYAITWLKVRPALSTSGEATRVSSWFGMLADANSGYYDSRPRSTDSKNNHRYWAGMAVMAAGIATNDTRRYRWGIDSYQVGVEQIAADGTLSLELARKSMALHYHLFAAEPLVIMAELAEANGGDLYRADGDALARLVKRSTEGTLNPAFFEKAAGIAQKETDNDPNLLAWVLTYDRRFPSRTLDQILSGLSSTSAIYLGGEPPAAR
ncbi:MAG: Polysaccharide lyase [Luteibacter sp.]|nr:MAG: Polysaccharide lyase [Luteibacter sp.]